MKNTDRLDKLEMLRFLAFAGVFLCHTDYPLVKPWGGWGVSVFLVLSGFLMTYSYYGKNRIQNVGIIDNIKFAWRKVWPLYPLHIACTFISFPLCFAGERAISFGHAVLNTVLNIFLVQDWIPIYFGSLNGTSWYLSAALFCYFIFPFILKLFEDRKMDSKQALVCIIALLFVQFGIALIADRIPNFDYVKGSLLDNDLSGWFSNYCPFTRIVDFSIGCCLCVIFLRSQKPCGRVQITGMELFGIILAIANNYILHESVIMTIGTVFLVYSFALGKGRISEFLDCKITRYFARIGRYGFLVHFVIFRYLKGILRVMMGLSSDAYAAKYGLVIGLSLGLILTVLGCEIWTLIQKKYIDGHMPTFLR